MKKKSKFIIVSCCLLLTLPCFLFARNNEWAEFFQKRQISSYAVQDSIHWIGTGFGLLKYNSENEKIQYLFQINNIDTANINDTAISENGKVWFVINRSSLLCFDGETWIHHSSSNSDFPKGNITKITTDDTNNLWAIIDNKLMKFDGENWRNFEDIESFLGRCEITDMLYHNDYVWLTLPNGICFFNGHIWEKYVIDTSVPFPSKRRIRKATDNSLLVNSYDRIHNVLIDSLVTISPINIEPKIWGITDFIVDKQGTIWITQSSYEYGYPTTLNKINYKSLVTEIVCSRNEQVFKQIEIDNKGGLWIVTYNYLYKFTENTLKYISLWNVDIPFYEIDESGRYEDIINLNPPYSKEHNITGNGNSINNQEEGHLDLYE